MELPAVWGVHSISKELFDCMRHFIPSGSTLLEFGSGWGTSQLSEHYDMISIEDHINFIDIYKSQYIYAPRVDNWYDIEKIKNEIKKPYHAVLVDGNSDNSRLQGLIANTSFFNWEVPWFFDDLNITTINMDFERFMMELNRPFVKYQCGPKPFGVVLPTNWSGTLWNPNEVKA